MNHSRFSEAHTPTPSPSIHWRQLTVQDRLSAVRQIVVQSNLSDKLVILRTTSLGQIIVALAATVSTQERSNLLLDFEAKLKAHIDEGLCLWNEPLGDKNSLRKLRGITIESKPLPSN